MLNVKDLNARGGNAYGDYVIDYALATKKLTKALVGEKGMEVDTMRWGGKGADHFGLLGKPVERDEMLELSAGYSPDGLKTPLCQNAGLLP